MEKLLYCIKKEVLDVSDMPVNFDNEPSDSFNNNLSTNNSSLNCNRADSDMCDVKNYNQSFIESVQKYNTCYIKEELDISDINFDCDEVATTCGIESDSKITGIHDIMSTDFLKYLSELKKEVEEADIINESMSVDDNTAVPVITLEELSKPSCSTIVNNRSTVPVETLEQLSEASCPKVVPEETARVETFEELSKPSCPEGVSEEMASAEALEELSEPSYPKDAPQEIAPVETLEELSEPNCAKDMSEETAPVAILEKLTEPSGSKDVCEETIPIEPLKKLSMTTCLKCNSSSKIQNAKIVKCQWCKSDMVFTCVICGQNYKELSDIYSHMRLMHSNHFTSFTQERNKEALKIPALPVNHEKIVRDQKKPLDSKQCGQCGIRFKSRGHLSNHVKFCGKFGHLKCNYCSYKAKINSCLRSHVKIVHAKKNKGSNASLPNSAISNASVLKTSSHNTSIIKTDCQRCKTCNKKFRIRGSLTNHVRFCGQKKQVFCEYCSYRGKTDICLKLHMKLQHREKIKHLEPSNITTSNKDFKQCNMCGMEFNSRGNLTNHMKFCGQKGDFSCDYCSFKTRADACLKWHTDMEHLDQMKGSETEVTKAASEDLNKQCNRCGMEFHTRGNLTNHVKFCGQNGDFSCNYCSFKTRTDTCLKWHIDMEHPDQIKGSETKVSKAASEDLNKQCNGCGTEFIYRRNLTNHAKFCGQKGDFSCDYCSFKAKVDSGLKWHIEMMHSEKIRVSKTKYLKAASTELKHCSNCGMEFICKSSLTNHIKFCSRMGHLICHYCPQKARTNYRLKSHIKIMHPKKINVKNI